MGAHAKYGTWLLYDLPPQGAQLDAPNIRTAVAEGEKAHSGTPSAARALRRGKTLSGHEPRRRGRKDSEADSASPRCPPVVVRGQMPVVLHVDGRSYFDPHQRARWIALQRGTPIDPNQPEHTHDVVSGSAWNEGETEADDER